jgi:hypothetical protein
MVAIGWKVSSVHRFSLGAWKYNVHEPEGRGESISGVDILVGMVLLSQDTQF